ncbi:MAG: gliding motility-associated C-terminal domain-containing protein [Flavobacteriales bacterium]|nr:gliding motility-associated C-terminal domain-containing protein [Flavobacteriales bacterium]
MTLLVNAQPPTVHTSNLAASEVYCNQLKLSWTDGNGDARIVFIREDTAVSLVPSSTKTYTADPNFKTSQNADPTGKSVTKVVYDNGGGYVYVTGLKKNTTYYFAVYEYNINSGTYEYLTTGSYATLSVKTENIVAAFSINDTYQCLSGNSVTTSNSSSNSLGLSMTYEWDFGDGSTKQTSTNASRVYTKGGIFDITLTATATGCKTSTILRDTILIPYKVDFKISDTIDGNDSIRCFGSNVFVFDNKSNLPNPPIYGLYDGTKYLWHTSTNVKGNYENFQYTTSASGYFDVTLVMGRKVSPKGEYCYDSITHRYFVLPPTIDSSKVHFSDTALCLNTNKFTFSQSGNNIISTLWKFGDGNTSTNNPATWTYNSVGKFQVTCEVEDINGCKASFSDTVEVLAPPDNTVAGLKTEYCLNEVNSVQLQPKLSGGYFYGAGVDAANSTFSPDKVGTFDFFYVYTIGNCKDTFPMTTTVLARPSFNLGKDTLLCKGTDIVLQVDSAGLNYLWDDGSTNQTRTVSSGGTYWAQGSNGKCNFRDTIKIRQVVLPKMNLGNDTSICGGEYVDLNVVADAGTILWSDGNTQFSRQATQSGLYVATVTHPCGVVSDSIKIDILPTACEIFIPNVFSPNRDDLNEDFYPKGLFVFTSMLIFDEYGQQIFESYEEGKGWDGTVNGKVVMPGAYYFIIHYQLPEGGTYVKKLASGPVYVVY